MIVVLAGKTVKGNITINVTDDSVNSEEGREPSIPM